MSDDTEYLDEDEDDDDGGEDEDGETEDEPYEFVSTGGCAICDAAEGTYTSAPERPHPYCDCQVVYSPRGYRPRIWGNCSNEWSAQYVETVYDLTRTPMVSIVTFRVDVTCWNGTTATDNVDVEVEEGDSWPDESDFEDEADTMINDHCPDTSHCPGIG